MNNEYQTPHPDPHWNHADADMICLSLKEQLDIAECLDMVVGESADSGPLLDAY